MGYSNEDIAEIIESEGLGYAVESYIDPFGIEDVQLQMYWQTAKANLEAIREHLKGYLE